MEAIGAVIYRPMAILSSGVTESVYHGRSMRIPSREATKKLAWSGSLSNSLFLDKGHLEYYNSNRFQKIECHKVYAGSKTEKKMKKKKDIEAKENKKRLKMLKGLSSDLLLLSKTGSVLGLDREAQPEMISDAVMQLQEQMQQLLTKENELTLKIKAEKDILKAEQIPTLDSEIVSSCSSESSDSECNNDVMLDSGIDMQNPLLLLQGQLQKLRIKEKEVKKKRKEEKKILKKLDSGMHSSSSSDSECEELAVMNKPSCFLSPAEIKQRSNELQEINTMFRKTAVLEENRVNDFGQDYITEIAEYTLKPAHVEESESTTKRVEVCMGGKCKKSGSLLLMEEFQSVLGNEGAVSGCKCMGKCKNGPNVRVFKSVDGLLANGLVAEPILSVGLGDVGSIVANIRGESGLVEARHG